MPDLAARLQHYFTTWRGPQNLQTQNGLGVVSSTPLPVADYSTAQGGPHSATAVWSPQQEKLHPRAPKGTPQHGGEFTSKHTPAPSGSDEYRWPEGEYRSKLPPPISMRVAKNRNDLLEAFVGGHRINVLGNVGVITALSQRDDIWTVTMAPDASPDAKTHKFQVKVGVPQPMARYAARKPSDQQLSLWTEEDERQHPRAPSGPKGGQWVKGQKITVKARRQPNEPGLTDAYYEPRELEIKDIKEGTAHLGHSDREFAHVKMPVESIPHFVNDLAGIVDVPPDSGDPDVDAVASGKAEYLGKGDDGLVFRNGPNVIKVSTTVPFIPENPFHRSPKEAADMLAHQVEISEAMREAGVPGILKSRLVRHGDKAFQIKPYVHIHEKWTKPELQAVEDGLHKMHEAGFTLNDEVQVGELNGDLWLFDTGKAERLEGTPGERKWAIEGDESKLKFLFSKNDVKWMPRQLDKAHEEWAEFVKDPVGLYTPGNPKQEQDIQETRDLINHLHKVLNDSLHIQFKKGPALPKSNEETKAKLDSQKAEMLAKLEPPKPKDVGPAGKTKSQVVEEVTGGKKTGHLTYDESCRCTFAYTGTSPNDWKAVAIEGMAETKDDKGNDVSMPTFDMPQGYTPVATFFEQPQGGMSGGCCELCGHDIKRAYFLQNDKDKLTMLVGSECVTAFGEGKSGKRLEKEAQWSANRDVLRQVWDAREKMAKMFGSETYITKKQEIATVHDAEAQIVRALGYRHGDKIKPDDREVIAKKAREVFGLWKRVNALTFNSKGAPIHPDEYAHVTSHYFGSGRDGNWKAYTTNYEPATDTVISGWIKRNGDEARKILEEVDQLTKPNETQIVRNSLTDRLQLAISRYARHKPSAGQGGFAWEPSEHPREPKGHTDPHHRPGTFAPKPATAEPAADEPFALSNPAPKKKPQEFENVKAKQQPLISGLDALPGQQDLFGGMDDQTAREQERAKPAPATPALNQMTADQAKAAGVPWQEWNDAIVADKDAASEDAFNSWLEYMYQNQAWDKHAKLVGQDVMVNDKPGKVVAADHDRITVQWPDGKTGVWHAEQVWPVAEWQEKEAKKTSGRKRIPIDRVKIPGYVEAHDRLSEGDFRHRIKPIEDRSAMEQRVIDKQVFAEMVKSGLPIPQWADEQWPDLVDTPEKKQRREERQAEKEKAAAEQNARDQRLAEQKAAPPSDARKAAMMKQGEWEPLPEIEGVKSDHEVVETGPNWRLVQSSIEGESQDAFTLQSKRFTNRFFPTKRKAMNFIAKERGDYPPSEKEAKSVKLKKATKDVLKMAKAMQDRINTKYGGHFTEDSRARLAKIIRDQRAHTGAEKTRSIFKRGGFSGYSLAERMQLAVTRYAIGKVWDERQESLHPRGQPQNSGRFRKKGLAAPPRHPLFESEQPDLPAQGGGEPAPVRTREWTHQRSLLGGAPSTPKLATDMTKEEFELLAMTPEQSEARVRQIRAGQKESRHKGEPSPEGKTESLVETRIPVSLFTEENRQFLSETTDPERVKAYAGQNIQTPIYAFPRRNDRYSGYGWGTSDGAHRLMAAIQRGDKYINALVPATSYDKIMEHHKSNYSLADRLQSLIARYAAYKPAKGQTSLWGPAEEQKHPRVPEGRTSDPHHKPGTFAEKPKQPEPSSQPVATFRGEDLEANIFLGPRGFNVSFKDIESGNTLPAIKSYPSLADATEYAKKTVGHPDSDIDDVVTGTYKAGFTEDPAEAATAKNAGLQVFQTRPEMTVGGKNFFIYTKDPSDARPLLLWLREHGMGQTPEEHEALHKLIGKAEKQPEPESPAPEPEPTPEPEAKEPSLEDLTMPADPDESEPEGDIFSNDPNADKPLPIDADDPRKEAAEQEKANQSEYIYARESAVPNVGADIKGSARHKVNAWRGLEQAEKDGTAAEMVTRAMLEKTEPDNLPDIVEARPQNALSAMAMRIAMNRFPAKPGYGGRGGWRTDKSPEGMAKNRSQYLDAYRHIKKKAEFLAATETNPKEALSKLRAEALSHIQTLRTGDRYNETANGLTAFVNTASSPYNGPAMRGIREFNEKFQAYMAANEGADADKERAAKVKDILFGMSLNKAFGQLPSQEGHKGKPKPFDDSKMYVGDAVRVGGRPLKTTNPADTVRKLKSAMKMYAVQWGNSVTETERPHHAQKVAEALIDLADIVGLPITALSAEGKLGLAIGARGRGKAMAHYESLWNPKEKKYEHTINLTRLNGVGTLAHEWGHMFDHWTQNFGFTTSGGERDHLYGSEHAAAGRTYERDEHGRLKRDENGNYVEKYSDDPMWRAFATLKRAMDDSGFEERLSDHVRKMGREGLLSQDKRSYFRSMREKFARSFETHVQHKLEEAGRKNTYLSGLPRAKTAEEVGPTAGIGLWPTAEESAKMAPAFDALLEAWRKHKYPDMTPEQIAEGNAKYRMTLADRVRYAMERSHYAYRPAINQKSIRWEEGQHPRGMPDNKGEFAPKPATTSAPSARAPQHAVAGKIGPAPSPSPHVAPSERQAGRKGSIRMAPGTDQPAGLGGPVIHPAVREAQTALAWHDLDTPHGEHEAMSTVAEIAGKHGLKPNELWQHATSGDVERDIEGEMKKKTENDDLAERVRAAMAKRKEPASVGHVTGTVAKLEERVKELERPDYLKGVKPGSRHEQLINEAIALGELSRSNETGNWSMGPYTAKTAKGAFAVGGHKKTIDELKADLDADKKLVAMANERAGIKTPPKPGTLLSGTSLRELELIAREGHIKRHFASLEEAKSRNSLVERITVSIARYAERPSVVPVPRVGQTHVQKSLHPSYTQMGGVVPPPPPPGQATPAPTAKGAPPTPARAQAMQKQAAAGNAPKPRQAQAPSPAAPAAHQGTQAQGAQPQAPGPHQWTPEQEKLHPRGHEGTEQGGKFVRKGETGTPTDPAPAAGKEAGRAAAQPGAGGPPPSPQGSGADVPARQQAAAQAPHAVRKALQTMIGQPGVQQTGRANNVAVKPAAAKALYEHLKDQEFDGFGHVVELAKGELSYVSPAGIIGIKPGKGDSPWLVSYSTVDLMNHPEIQARTAARDMGSAVQAPIEGVGNPSAEDVKAAAAKRKQEGEAAAAARAQAAQPSVADATKEFTTPPVEQPAPTQEPTAGKPKGNPENAPLLEQPSEAGGGYTPSTAEQMKKLAEKWHAKNANIEAAIPSAEDMSPEAIAERAKKLKKRGGRRENKKNKEVSNELIKKAAEDWEVSPVDLEGVVNERYEAKAEEHRKYEQAKKELRELMHMNGNDVRRLDKAGRDHSSVPGFDTAARTAATLPELNALGIGGYEGGANASDTDYAARVWELLKEGKVPEPDKADFIDDAARYVSENTKRYKPSRESESQRQAREEREAIQGEHEAVADTGNEGVPFSMRMQAAVARYRQGSHKSLARAVSQTHTSPSEAQAKAGNYSKGEFGWNGMTITVETPKGALRVGKGDIPLGAHYGYLNSTVGADKDQLDVWIGPNPESEAIFVLDQVREDGRFDEHKLFISFDNQKSAIDAYKASYPRGWKVGPVTPMTLPQFKEWLARGDKKRPVNASVRRYSAVAAIARYMAQHAPSSNQTSFWGPEQEREHPRASKGSPTGGKFVSKGQGSTATEPKPSPDAAWCMRFIAKEMQRSPLTPGKRQQYTEAANSVLSKMNDTALSRFQMGVAKVEFHEDMDSLTAASNEIAANNGQPPSKFVGGYYRPKYKLLALDGGEDTGEFWSPQNAADTYAHEFGHAVDGPQKTYSDSPAWKSAWTEEICREDAPLSRYAMSVPTEGFAEFARLAFLGREAEMSKFPKCQALWKEWELI